MLNKTNHFTILTLSLALLAFFLQSQILLNGDVAFLLHDTSLFMSGGQYITDFFETNPPMIFYLYSPIHIIHALTTIDLAKSAHLYIISLALVSVACCYRLINKVVKKEDAFITYSFLYTLLFAFLFLPSVEFGQREHVFLILMMPYVLAVVCAAEEQCIHPVFSFFIGMMMGLGVGLKPYFLMPFILMEVYLMIVKRSVWSWIRITSLTCASVLVIYLISIFIWQSNYINIMLPLIHHLYFSSIQETWFDIFSRSTVIFCFCVAGFYLFYPKKKYPSLMTVLELALIGTMIAFIITRTGWFYHVIPALGLSCLLISLYIANFFLSYTREKPLTKGELTLIAAGWIAIFFIPIHHGVVLFQSHLHKKSQGKFVELVTYIKSLPNRSSIYCFSTDTTSDCFPLVNLVHSQFGGRMPFFWWLRGMLGLERKHLPVPDKDYVINSLAEDLNHYQTQLIVINVAEEKALLGNDFDYVKYLSHNNKFLDAWRAYRYAGQVGGVFEIYQRQF